VLDDAIVQRVARHWEDGWNAGDVDTIMEPFADNVVFASPGIAMMTGDSSRATIEGKDALRDYIAGALRQTSKVRYRLTGTYVGTDSVVLAYSCGVPGKPQKLGADIMRVDADGNVVEWRCHY
jgi:ketosteroid isomerase-like protein